MKRLLYILMLLLSCCIYAQEKKEIDARRLYVSFDKAKHIVFPYQVSDISFGREEYIETERVQNAPHIIRITALEEDFPGTTNLVVVCMDGSVYSYTVEYRSADVSDIGGNIIYAQGENTSKQYNVIVNSDNTTEMFFPGDILYLRQGNEEVFRIEYYNNIVKVTTDFQEFETSNLFVVDKNLNTYEITLLGDYSDTYSYNFDNGRKYVARVDVNSIEMDNFISSLRFKKRNIYSVGIIKNKFEISLTNLYVQGEFMFFVFDIKNFSNIDYDIDFLKCFLRDMKKKKNAIQQEVQYSPVWQKDFYNKIPGKSENRFVLVFNKFTIPDDKVFEIEMFERMGGRHMKLPVLNEYILSAQLLK